jgi:uncharacterized protein YceK
MKTFNIPVFSTLLTVALTLSGCSAITDSIGASTQTFTNTTESSSRISSSNDSSHASLKTQQAIEFAKVNWMQLSSNMANGQGEYLSVIADLLGVNPAQKQAFYNLSKSKFSQFFPSTETTPEQLVNRLKTEASHLGMMQTRIISAVPETHQQFSL